VQRSGWLVPQVALLHTWVGEDQHRVNPIQRCHLSNTPYHHHHHHHLEVLYENTWDRPGQLRENYCSKLSVTVLLRVKHG